MCYETSLTKKLAAIEKHTGAVMQYPEVYEPWYHLSGFTHCFAYQWIDHVLFCLWNGD
ncbi:hypothetical protein J0871_05025 [Salegentibacter sp. BDJ18]|uniref:hypothetical protein n=1 Tax=Salegentibacter sp. BDJ18 TaxID=2816376 RepID=UPI001AAED537|nr:hypothetical protein [Salegentibacter sp. BDJ18]MBO2543772.1 hypothetical protein [Salegentibacter sp. BDJ18]